MLLGGATVFKAALAQACDDLIASTDLLNELDTGVGDGDCGSTLANGARCMCSLTFVKLYTECELFYCAID